MSLSEFDITVSECASSWVVGDTFSFSNTTSAVASTAGGAFEENVPECYDPSGNVNIYIEFIPEDGYHFAAQVESSIPSEFNEWAGGTMVADTDKKCALGSLTFEVPVATNFGINVARGDTTLTILTANVDGVNLQSVTIPECATEEPTVPQTHAPDPTSPPTVPPPTDAPTVPPPTDAPRTDTVNGLTENETGYIPTPSWSETMTTKEGCCTPLGPDCANNNVCVNYASSCTYSSVLAVALLALTQL